MRPDRGLKIKCGQPTGVFFFEIWQ